MLLLFVRRRSRSSIGVTGLAQGSRLGFLTQRLSDGSLVIVSRLPIHGVLAAEEVGQVSTFKSQVHHLHDLLRHVGLSSSMTDLHIAFLSGKRLASLFGNFSSHGGLSADHFFCRACSTAWMTAGKTAQ